MATLARHSGVVQDQAGNIIPNAKIEVRKETPGAPLAAPKEDRDGLVNLGNPFNANADGSFAFHVVGGAYKVRAYVGASGAPTFEYIERFIANGTAAEHDAEDFVAAGTVRERLTANRTYYVASSGAGGSDSNSGLSALAPFLTIQKAIDTVAALDCSIYDVSISCASATYAPFVLKSFLGAAKVTITGDTTTPANCIIASTAADGVGGSNVIGRYKIEGFKFTNATSGSHIKIFNTYLELGANDYGAAVTAHVWIEQNAYVEFTANYTISGGATRHLFATTGGIFSCAGRTVTLTGTPAFSTAFIVGSRVSAFRIDGNTYSGSATGARYLLSFNAVADVAGAGASYLPGNSAGATASGGQYA
ncbi:hypothetical protein CSIRO_3027 [Bradyrhizobiaceae bacterium SG-6C]|nr:hypothetical protein CSIRO_3027 [Bradyrhizobiaceae bacterium SG-6C]